jgi:4-amino-4-deoxy-L-arabinose transferase-like glycosyltransferase
MRDNHHEQKNGFQSRELKSSSPVKNHWRIQHVVIIFLLALFIRGFYLYDSRDNPTFQQPIVDAKTYDRIARGVIETGKLTQDLFWQPPFYPIFLTVVYSFTKGSILSAKIFQMILGALTCVFVYLLGTKILNRKTGLLAGIITAFYIPLVFFEGELLATGWAAFWSVVILMLLLKTAEEPRDLHCLFLGFCGAFFILTRPVFLPFLLAGCLWLIFVLYRQNQLKFSLQKTSIITAGFLIVAIPTGILGLSTTGKFRILPFSGGINLYLGNNPNFKETTTIRPGLA